MSVLSNIEPKGVFHFFEEICKIPHGSTNTKQISDWLFNFAKERNLEAYQDEYNNVIIVKEATKGYENAETVIIQGHMDMVCEKAPDCDKDMETKGLDLVVDGGVVYAKGTTLGGDDGIAVAMALAILDSDDIPHPRLEVVITSDEEIGMLGAVDMDVSILKGRKMINIDSEDEGVFTVSCAGGNLTHCSLPISRENFGGEVMTVKVGGLKGGHSGIEINKGLGNACMLLGRVLNACSLDTNLRIVSAEGGMKDNAIPRESIAVIMTDNKEAVISICKTIDAELKNEYQLTDKDVFVSVSSSECDTVPLDKDSTERLICFLMCAPNGIQEMSAGIKDLVQTSLNLGVLEVEENEASASFCVRSSIDSQKYMLVEKLECLSRSLGGKVDVSGDYSGWEYRPNSPLRDIFVEVFKEQYGHEPKIEAIHAGIECGIFSGKLQGLDCISIGPDLKEVHTCREKLIISSTERLWKMLLEVLKRIK